ncbi:NAD(P)/FAD-dependent oxidoreductase [Sphaerisporangium sp. NPDC004334]
MTDRHEQTARTAPDERERDFDVVVVGGGAAGLSGALTLARARRSVLVVDAGGPRNAPAAAVHNYLGREGTPPARLLAEGRAEVARYGGSVLSGEVIAVERTKDGRFRVVPAGGSPVRARRLLVATGLADEPPKVAGLAERWGRDVLHCPYCHGWEVRDQPIAVLATSALAAEQALLWRQWSPRVTLLLHTAPEPSAGDRERLAARDIAVVEGEATGLEVGGDRLTGVRLADGRVVPCTALVVMSHLSARTGALAGLGLEPVEQSLGGHVVGTRLDADPMGATGVPGVWVAGNVTDLMGQVVTAAAAGMRAAAAINADLVQEETRLAVAARRAAPVQDG